MRVVELIEPSGFDAAIAEAKAWGAQGVVELASPFLFKHRAVLLDALRTHQLPAACALRQYAAEGCLVTYSADFVAIHRRIADYADRILKGATPADLAIEADPA